MAETEAPTVVTSLAAMIDHDMTAYYDDLRGRGDILWDAGVQAFLVTSPALIEEIARMDTIDWFSSLEVNDTYVPLGLDEDTWWTYSGSRYRLTSLSGPLQPTLHRWWLQAFSPARCNEWRTELVMPIANATIDRFVAAGEADLHEQYARRASHATLATIGLPYDDEAWIAQLDGHMSDIEVLLAQAGTEKPSDELVERCTNATRDAHALMMPYVEERRDGTGSDFISAVWRDADELWGEGQWDVEDVASAAVTAFFGGASTIVSTTASAIYLVLTQPGLQDALRADPAGFKPLADETLRMHGNSSFGRRIAKRDVKLGGIDIKAGQIVFTLNECAGQDPEKWTCPHDVKLDRKDSTDHFSFWRGPRQCPGRQLARMEISAFVEVLLDRLEEIQINPTKPAPVYRGFLTREWAPLNATFTVRS